MAATGASCAQRRVAARALLLLGLACQLLPAAAAVLAAPSAISSGEGQHVTTRRGLAAARALHSLWKRDAATRGPEVDSRELRAVAAAANPAAVSAAGGSGRRLSNHLDSGGPFTGGSSTPATAILKPGELPKNHFIPIFNITYRVSGPEMRPLTPALQAAIVRTFHSTYGLFDFAISVNVTPAMPAPVFPLVAHSASGRSALPPPVQVGKPPARQGNRRLLMTYGHRKVKLHFTSLSQYQAVDAIVVGGFTATSTFQGLSGQSQAEQRAVLQDALHTIGIDANVLGTSLNSGPQIAENVRILVARVPEYSKFLNISTYIVLVGYDGVGPPTVTQQTALELAIDDITPKMFTCGVLQVNTTAGSRSGVITALVSTAHRAGEFPPEVYAADLQSQLGGRLSQMGWNVTLRVTVVAAPIPAGFGKASSGAANETFESQPLSDFGIIIDPITRGSSIASHMLSTGAIVGIIVAVVFMLLCASALFALAIRRRRRQLRDIGNDSSDGSNGGDGLGVFDEKLQGFLIAPEEIDICTRDDGTDWLLAKTPYGRVLRGVRGGVQDVAVKRLVCTANDQDLAKFVEEVRMLKGLNYDRNITQFYGACIKTSGDRPMLVSEFMEGGDLCTAIENDDTEELRWYNRGHRIALDVVRGLYFLHSHDVQHGGLHSSCILLTSGLQAKIGDVGLSRLAETMMAKPEGRDHWDGFSIFFAPESSEGNRGTWRTVVEDPGVPGDIYSFGVVLLEIVTGILPKARGQMPPPLVPDECPEDVWQLIRSCIAPDPDARPSAKVCFDTLRASVEASVAAGDITLAPSVREYEPRRSTPLQPGKSVGRRSASATGSSLNSGGSSQADTAEEAGTASTGDRVALALARSQSSALPGVGAASTRSSSGRTFSARSTSANSNGDSRGSKVMRLAAGAAAREALLTHLNSSRPHMRRTSSNGDAEGSTGGGGGSTRGSTDAAGTGGGTGGSSPPADVVEAAARRALQPLRTPSRGGSSRGQPLPPVADVAADLQQRLPSDMSTPDAADMYGAFAADSPVNPTAAAELQQLLPSNASTPDAANMYGAFAAESPVNPRTVAEMQQQLPSKASTPNAANMYGAFAAESPAGPDAASAAPQPQQSTLLTASEDGAAMYGIYEDAVWSLSAGDAGATETAVLLTATSSSTPTEHASPFAVAAEQQQRRSLEDRRSAQPAGGVTDGAAPPPAPCTLETNDSAYERQASGSDKGQSAVPAVATRRSAEASRRRSSVFSEYYSPCRSRYSTDSGGTLSAGRFGLVDLDALNVDPAKLAAEAAEIRDFARFSETASPTLYMRSSLYTRSSHSDQSAHSKATSGGREPAACASVARRSASWTQDIVTSQQCAADGDRHEHHEQESCAQGKQVASQPASPGRHLHMDLYATFADPSSPGGEKSAKDCVITEAAQ